MVQTILRGEFMGKFMVATFLVLGWAFWEMSGGADFVPEERIVAERPMEDPSPAVEVTRAATQDLVPISMPVTQPAPPPADQCW